MLCTFCKSEYSYPPQCCPAAKGHAYRQLVNAAETPVNDQMPKPRKCRVVDRKQIEDAAAALFVPFEQPEEPAA